MKFEKNWQFKTLENLEKDVWPEEDFDSHVVRRTSELRKVPLNEFSVEDLRIMIGQNFSLPYLVPLALDRLEENVLAEGDFYPGDLLVAVSSAVDEFWDKNREYEDRLRKLISVNVSLIIENKVKLGKRFSELVRR